MAGLGEALLVYLWMIEVVRSTLFEDPIPVFRGQTGFQKDSKHILVQLSPSFASGQ